MKHIQTYKAKYREIDQMGFLHNSVYQVYFDEARIEMIRDKISYKQIEEDGIIIPVKYLKIDFIRPILYDEEFMVETCLSSIGKCSAQFYYEMVKADRTIVCKAETTNVFLDKATGKFVKIPDYLREHLHNYLHEPQ